MKRIFLNLLAVAAAAGIGTATAAPDCDQAAAKLEAGIKKEPDQVLVLLTRYLSKNEECACELVKTAIEATNADVAMVRQIVTAAVLVDGVKAATVAECATAARPEAASEIKAALNEVFAGAEEEVDDVVVVDGDGEGPTDFVPRNLTVSGVYMIPPIAGGGVDLRAFLNAQGFSDSQINRILSGRATAEQIIREIVRRRSSTTIIQVTTPPSQSP